MATLTQRQQEQRASMFEECRKQLQTINGKVQDTFKGMPHSMDELKAQTITFKPVVEEKLYGVIGDVKTILLDIAPVVEFKKQKDMVDVYFVSLLCLIAAQVSMSFGSLWLVSALVTSFLTPVGSALFALVFVPCVTVASMKHFADPFQQSFGAFSSVVFSALLAGVTLNGTSLPFQSPPFWMIPLSVAFGLPLANEEQRSQTRVRQLAFSLIPSAFAYTFIGYIGDCFNSAFMLWTLALLGFGFTDLQMNFAALQSRGKISPAYQQYSTCFVLFSISFFFAYACSSPLVPLAKA